MFLESSLGILEKAFITGGSDSLMNYFKKVSLSGQIMFNDFKKLEILYIQVKKYNRI